MQRVLLVTICALVASLLLGQAAAARGKQTVAILPIVVNATQERDYLRSGLADMLASRLGQEDGIAVLRVDDPELATTDAATAQAAAKKAGADFVLFGSFTRFGEGASLDVRCLAVGGDASDSKAVFVQAGTLGDIIPRLDNLSKRVAHHMNGGTRGKPAAASGGSDVGDALSELDALRGRVEALERQVFSGDGADSGETAAR